MNEVKDYRWSEIIEAFERLYNKNVIDSYAEDQPAVIIAGPYKYVYHLIFIETVDGEIFEAPLLREVYYEDKLVDKKLYSVEELKEIKLIDERDK